MHIFIYSDESGVFDKVNNDYFVFAGIICFGKNEKDNWTRRYSAVERTLRKSNNLQDIELKACILDNKQKGTLFRSLNNYRKFAVIIKQKSVFDSIFKDKKSKQRYLDYAYKIAVKNAFEFAIKNNEIKSTEVTDLHFYVDEHSTATNGRYELRESLEGEFKNGTHNWNYTTYFPPLFENLNSVDVVFCNSKQHYLVRASDIIANRIYYLSRHNNLEKLQSIKNLNIIWLP
ncbi:DUF3800 domain-containing protein [uncultured Veillonella sp.]|uniref:DUF3800 domain-containing protein n=1 Tax=uncultured Veillonella sp. TaxID=159268 RepID=UPI0025F34106|nr:DUF3800 domain-containing protein [uncultured Veillonella sp.]